MVVGGWVHLSFVLYKVIYKIKISERFHLSHYIS